MPLLLGDLCPGCLGEAPNDEPGPGPRLGPSFHAEELAGHTHVNELAGGHAVQPACRPLERGISFGAAGITGVSVPEDRERAPVREQQAVECDPEERGQVGRQGQDIGRDLAGREPVGEDCSAQQVSRNRPPIVAELVESPIVTERARHRPGGILGSGQSMGCNQLAELLVRERTELGEQFGRIVGNGDSGHQSIQRQARRWVIGCIVAGMAATVAASLDVLGCAPPFRASIFAPPFSRSRSPIARGVTHPADEQSSSWALHA